MEAAFLLTSRYAVRRALCGESSALMRSIGAPACRGEIHHATEKGLWTSNYLNNVETWANVPTIIEKALSGSVRLELREALGRRSFARGQGQKERAHRGPHGMTLCRRYFPWRRYIER